MFNLLSKKIKHSLDVPSKKEDNQKNDNQKEDDGWMDI
jgi:hypothetical protein